MRLYRPLAVLVLAFSGATAHGNSIILSTNDKAYDAFTGCVSDLKKPHLCLDTFNDYFKSSYQVIKLGGRAEQTERERLKKTLSFLADSADQYAVIAREKGSEKAAQAAISIYRKVASVQGSRRDELNAKADALTSIASARSLAVGLNGRIDTLDAVLANDGNASDQFLSAIRPLAKHYDSLPAPLRERSSTFAQDISDWLLDFVNQESDSLLDLNVNEYMYRRAVYVASQDIPNANNNVDEELIAWNRSALSFLNQAAQTAQDSFDAAHSLWDEAHAAESLTSPSTDAVSRHLASLSEQAGRMERFNVWFDDAKAVWPEFKTTFSAPSSLVEKPERLLQMRDAFELVGALKEDRIYDSLPILERVAGYGWVAKDTTKTLVHNHVKDVFIDRFEVAKDRGLAPALDYLVASNAHSDSAFVAALIDEYASAYLLALLDEPEDVFAELPAVASAYEALRPTLAGKLDGAFVAGVGALFTEDYLEDSLDERGLIRTFTGYQTAVRSLDQIDANAAQRFDEQLIRLLLESDTDEIDALRKVYLGVTTPETVADADRKVEHVGDVVRYYEDRESELIANDGQEVLAGARLLYVMTERERRNFQPVSVESRRAALPEPVFTKCALNAAASGKVELGALEANADALDDYSFSILDMARSPDDFTSIALTLAGMDDYPRVISERDYIRLKVDNLKALSAQCGGA